MTQTSLLETIPKEAPISTPLPLTSNPDFVMMLADKLDFIDVQLLRKFYMTGRDFPNDTQPYCFPLLFREMRESHHLKIGIEALRKRVNNLEKIGLIIKINHSNPTNYMPVRGLEHAVRATVAKFFIINGIDNFL